MAASAEAVWRVVSDPGAMARVAAEYEAFEWLDGASESKVGARFRGRNRRGAARWSTVATIVVAEPGREFTFDVTALHWLYIARWQYLIEPTETGCRVTESTWRKSPTALARAFGYLIGAPDRDAVNAQHIDTTLRQLKAYLEANSESG